MRPILLRTLLLLAPIVFGSCSIPAPVLEQVKRTGVLVVATRNSPTIYFEGRDGTEGFEHDLVQEFAKELGVKVQFKVPERFPDMLQMVVEGEVQMAAAGLAITDRRLTSLRFTPGFQEVKAQLVYSSEGVRPESPADLKDGILEVVAESSHEEDLEALREKYPDLQWKAQSEAGVEELIYLVHQQVIDYTVADSNEFAINQRYYPDLDVAFDVGPPREVGWAFPHTVDRSLYDAACEFIERMKKSGRLKALWERYYGPVQQPEDVDERDFRRNIMLRLPEYSDLFREASEGSGLEWALLAAVGYQESHWNPDAVSPTGVKGLMMLTLDTAKRMGIEDRTDPVQSIDAGARYLKLLNERLPKSIKPPERIWFVLAAYNVGIGHLEDARVLTKRQGGNPSKWEDVKKRLPQLSRESYYSTVKHGYARGRQAVIFVENVKGYYEQLAWEDNLPPPPILELNREESDYPLDILPSAL